ncbi:hypothetical protein B0O99DRAFT_632232, partial [Bisporella sp. PMI_857]
MTDSSSFMWPTASTSLLLCCIVLPQHSATPTSYSFVVDVSCSCSSFVFRLVMTHSRVVLLSRPRNPEEFRLYIWRCLCHFGRMAQGAAFGGRSINQMRGSDKILEI